MSEPDKLLEVEAETLIVRWTEQGEPKGIVFKNHGIIWERLDDSCYVALCRLSRTRFTIAYYNAASDTSWLVELPRVPRAPVTTWRFNFREACSIWLEATGPLPESTETVVAFAEGCCYMSYHMSTRRK